MTYIHSVYSYTSITAHLASLDENYSYNDRSVSWYLNGVYKGYSRIPANVQASESITFSNLSPSTTYEIRAVVETSSSGKLGEFTATVTTLSIPTTPTPSKWSWTNSNGTATAQQTQKAYTAITTKGYTTDFPYQVWNDMVDKVNEIIKYENGTWRTNYLTLEDTKMKYNDRDITAQRYNSLLNNIWAYCGLADINQFSKYKVNTGDDVLGKYFTDIATYINNGIDKL